MKKKAIKKKKKKRKRKEKKREKESSYSKLIFSNKFWMNLVA